MCRDSDRTEQLYKHKQNPLYNVDIRQNLGMYRPGVRRAHSSEHPYCHEVYNLATDGVPRIIYLTHLVSMHSPVECAVYGSCNLKVGKISDARRYNKACGLTGR